MEIVNNTFTDNIAFSGLLFKIIGVKDLDI